MSETIDDRALLRRFAAEQSPWIDALLEVESGVLESLRADLAHEVAHARLAWWQDELTRLAEGEPRHPATIVLLREAHRRGHSSVDLRPLLASAERELAQLTPEHDAQWDAHWRDWGRSVYRLVCLFGLSRERLTLAEQIAALAGPAIHEIDRGAPAARLERASQRLQEALALAHTNLRATEFAGFAPAVLWISLAQRTAGHMQAPAAPSPSSLPSGLLPSGSPRHSLFEPLWRTVHAWRVVVALRRGRWPTLRR